MADNDLLNDIDPAFLAAATAAVPHAVASVSPDPVVSSPEDPSSFADRSSGSLDAALLDYDSDCTQSATVPPNPSPPIPVARRLRSHDGPQSRPAPVPVDASSDSDEHTSDDNAWTPVKQGATKPRSRTRTRTRTITFPSRSSSRSPALQQPFACLVTEDLSLSAGSEPSPVGSAAAARPAAVGAGPGKGRKLCPFGGHPIGSSAKYCRDCDRALPVNATYARRKHKKRSKKSQSPPPVASASKPGPTVFSSNKAAKLPRQQPAASPSSSSSPATFYPSRPLGVARPWREKYIADKVATLVPPFSVAEMPDEPTDPATLPSFRYPDNPIVHQSSDLNDVSVMMDDILPRVNGVIGALPAIPLLDPDTRLPTGNAEYTSLLRGAIDPIERDLAAADHIRSCHSHLYQHLRQSNPWMEVCADIMAGVNPDTFFINTPSVGLGHAKEAHAAVAEVIAKLLPKATELFLKCDDRIFSMLWLVLPTALLMHDPRGAPTGKGVANYDRRCLFRRIDAIDKLGYMGIAAIILDWRAVAHLRSLDCRTNDDLDPEDKLALVASLFARGVPLDECIQRTNNSPTVASDTKIIAEHFRLQEGPRDPPGPPPPLTSFDPATLTPAALRAIRPAGCPSPWRLPDQFDEDDKVNGLDYLGVRAAMIRTLRKVDPNAAPFIDGIPPATQKLFLTTPNGWESCMALVTAMDSDIMHVISHRNNTDPKTNLHTSLFLALSKRSRATLIPKPKVHSPWRILQIATLALSIHSGFINTVNAAATSLANGTHQLAGQPSGIDAAVILVQSWAQQANPDRARMEFDAVKHYNNIQHDKALGAATKRAPHLVPSVITASGKSTISLITDDARAQHLTIGLGYGQGMKGSTPIADCVMAQVVADALAHIDQLGLQDANITIISVADNISVDTPVSNIPQVEAALRKAAADNGVHLDDERIDLAGTTAERDLAQHRIENMPAGALNHRFDTWIVRSDLTQDPDDVCVMFGVPIFGGNPERIAYDLHMDRVVERQISHAQWVINIRNLALAPSTLPAGATRHQTALRSTSRQAMSILTNHARCLDHIVKCTPQRLVAAPFARFDTRLRALTREALRVPRSLPESSLNFLRRAPSLFGAGARPVMRVADDAFIGAHTATWTHLTVLLKSPQPPLLVAALLDAATRQKQQHTDLADIFAADLADPTLPPPPDALYKPADVPAIIEKQIIEPLRQGKPPVRVQQRTLARTRDYYDLQSEWFHPDISQCPDALSPDKKKQYMRDISERNRARGVADFWNDRTTMDVVTGSRLRLPYTEPQWTVAVRRYLGIGYSGLASCTDSSVTCRCNAWHRQNAVFMDPAANFHYNSCPWASGLRTNRHDALDPITRKLCGAAKRTYRSRHDITVNFDNVPDPAAKIMDAVIDDPHNGSSYYVDFHVIDPLAPSYCHIQKPGVPDSLSSLQHTVREAIKSKAKTYHREANHRGALLIPFVLTTAGGFTPRSPVHDGGGLLDPKDAFKSLFVGGKVPLRGSIGVSVEEGLLRSIAADAAGDTDNALYDKTLTRASGAGLLFNQVVRCMSHAVVRGSSDAVLSVLRRL